MTPRPAPARPQLGRVLVRVLALALCLSGLGLLTAPPSSAQTAMGATFSYDGYDGFLARNTDDGLPQVGQHEIAVVVGKNTLGVNGFTGARITYTWSVTRDRKTTPVQTTSVVSASAAGDAGELASYYAPTAADLGGVLSLRLEITRSGTATVEREGSFGEVQPPILTSKSFTGGSVAEGVTLTAVKARTTTGWLLADSCRAIDSATPAAMITGSSLTLPTGSATKFVALAFTYKLSGTTFVNRESECVGPIAPAPTSLPFDAAVAASFTGTAQAGETLTASGGSPSPAGTLSYAWRVGETTVSTAATYVPALADIGKPLVLTVTSKAAGYVDSTDETDAVLVERPDLSAGTLGDKVTWGDSVWGGWAATQPLAVGQAWGLSVGGFMTGTTIAGTRAQVRLTLETAQ